MMKWFKQVDSILRGDATRMEAIKDGHVEIPIAPIVAVTVLMCMFYGFCMGAFAAFSEGGAKVQLLASTLKFPLLFILTLLITFPSLYVFNALVGSKLYLKSTLTLLLASVAIIAAVSASLGPIVLFFVFSTQSYSFMVLLNVAACSVGGFLGLAFLLRTLHRLVIVSDPQLLAEYSRPKPPPVPEGPDDKNASDDLPSYSTVLTKLTNDQPPRSPLDQVGARTERKAKTVFRIWVVVFSLVGAQMSWVLRPFIGSPGTSFTWFREQESNFFEAVVRSIANLLGA